MKKALITGVTGQDGSYLAELLLAKGYEVHGVLRPGRSREAAVDLVGGPDGAPARLHLQHADLSDAAALVTLVERVQPHEVYNLAAQTHVRVSFDQPELTGEATGMGVTRLLEAIRTVGLPCRFFQASSSEIFGADPQPQGENTPFSPRSPYGAAKAYGHWMTRFYRETHGLFACNGILFNHESPRRGAAFVTRKITLAAAQFAAGRTEPLSMGNLDAARDWGYAPEYVEAMWLMLQHEEPRDFVVATGVAFTVRDFLQFAFERVGLDWRQHVQVDQQFLRPGEVDLRVGDPGRINAELGWKAQVTAPELARVMVDHDLATLAVAASE